MTQAIRIRNLRKELGLSQTAFGEALGVSRSVIQNIEDDARLKRPEQKAPLLNLICKTYNVNPEWLEVGTGDMFLPRTRETVIDSFVGKLLTDQPDSFRVRFVASLAKLSEEEWGVLERIVNGMAQDEEE